MSRTPQELETVARAIIDRVRGGDSLAQICRDMDMNFGSTWQRLSKPDLFPEYEQAAMARAHMWFEQLMQVADDTSQDRTEDGKGNMAAVARARLQVDTRKWALSKLIPRKYGDQLAITGAEGGPLEIRWAANPVLDISPDAIEASGK